LQYVTIWFHIQGMKTATESSGLIAEERLDAILHALSDRTRRALLKRLTHAPAMVTELAAPFPISRIAVGKHLRVLQGAGLVSRSIEGRIHRCSMNAAPLREVQQWLEQYRAFWTDKLESLARFAESGAAVGSRPRKKK
jgi:DNA-binding transcriptional ArsR family regulator